jgi:hypothetical protein
VRFGAFYGNEAKVLGRSIAGKFSGHSEFSHSESRKGICRKAADEQQRHYWKLTREGQDLLVGSMEWMLEQKEPTEAWRALLERTPALELQRACTHYRESRRLEQAGYVGVLRERLRWQVRPYLPEFLQLPFQAEAGAAGLQSLASASAYFRDKTLPSQTTPVEFLPAALTAVPG